MVTLEFELFKLELVLSLLLEKGQKDLGLMGNLQLEERELSEEDDISVGWSFLSLKKSLILLLYLEEEEEEEKAENERVEVGEAGVVEGREKDLEGDGQRELLRLMQFLLASL